MTEKDTAITQMPASMNSVTLWRKPAQVLSEAKEAAVALTEVIKLKKNPVIFNKEQYLEFEDWSTVAKFYGCTTKIAETNYVDFGGVKGFEAVAICLDNGGNEISRAESMCLSDEENWGDVPKYEWRDIIVDGKKVWDEGRKRYKAERIQIGTVPKPLFQLRSMAQTRACAKVLRQVFSWVVVLAGFKPNVAEEMTGNEFPADREDQSGEGEPTLQRKSDRGKPATETKAAQTETKSETKPSGENTEFITEKQRKMFFAITKSAQLPEERVMEVLGQFGIEHRDEIPKKQFNTVLEAIDPDFKFHTKS